MAPHPNHTTKLAEVHHSQTDLSDMTPPGPTGEVNLHMRPEQAMAEMTTESLLQSIDEFQGTKTSKFDPALTLTTSLGMVTLSKGQLASWLGQIVNLHLQLKHSNVLLQQQSKLVTQLQSETSGLKADLTSVKADLSEAQEQIAELKAQSKANHPQAGDSIASPQEIMTSPSTALSLEMTTLPPSSLSSEPRYFSASEELALVDQLRKQVNLLRRQENATQNHFADLQKRLTNAVKGRAPPPETKVEQPGTDPGRLKPDHVSQDWMRASAPPPISYRLHLPKPQRFDEMDQDTGLTRPSGHRDPDEPTVRPRLYNSDSDRDRRDHRSTVRPLPKRHDGHGPSDFYALKWPLEPERELDHGSPYEDRAEVLYSDSEGRESDVDPDPYLEDEAGSDCEYSD